MVPDRFMPSEFRAENDERAGFAGRAINTYHEEHDHSLDRDMLACLLCDLVHWADRNGVSFDAQLAKARAFYSDETQMRGTGGARYLLACELVASACGYIEQQDKDRIAHRDQAGTVQAVSWPDWGACCRDNGIAIDPPDPYEIAARAAGWTTIAEGRCDGDLICRRCDLSTRAGPEYGSWRACCQAQEIEPAEVPDLDAFVRYRLTLDVTFETNGVSTRDLERNLDLIANHAAGAGMLTGDTLADVDMRAHRVERLA